ncbi:Nicotinate-nucleotide-dimethylbenzimidazolephosp horibosyltransferase [Ignisphaera aggregans DSM 17230]|uniref:UPF0284 protein Igag_0331 n=1 Tax=Ignisphaera aggregans (strain DSM 17230 / JCM 13409 / AQ1.S1) TaxID=583356 RepID=E0SR28_IGNAA|nr:Nicotinate-nucleotide-dimethylbenzimidazolephosp horibosyltransferase [Ignisphaera aggregans DSM 17230]
MYNIGIVDRYGYANRIIAEIPNRNPIAVYFIANTMVSTVPGISIAGENPRATLYTPALDVEYLVYGEPKSGPLPVTPEGIPTPAIITRTSLNLLDIPFIVVDVGSYIDPRIPHIDIPGKSIGGRIDVEDALPLENVYTLFSYSKILGMMLGSNKGVIVIGESMPGGTTTAMAIMESLGYRAIGRVSSASPLNPHEVKKKVFIDAIKRSRANIPMNDVYRAIALFGDPLHISIAGFTSGAIEKGSIVLLAGGTQMCSVIAILKRLGISLDGRVAIATTRWIVEDSSSDIKGLVYDIAPEIPIIYTKLNFSNSRFSGLKAYENGYVKEGVGAGGTTVLLHIYRGIDVDTLLIEIEKEYSRIMDIAGKR